MVKIRIPASSANLGPGFDTLGLALNLYLTLKVSASAKETCLEFCGEGREYLSQDPGVNLILRSMQMVFSHNRVPMPPLNIQVESQIPLSRGLGSSAAAVVAGLCAANVLLGSKLSREHLLMLALQIEGHGDNVVPALLGGLNTVMVYKGRIYQQRIALPLNLQVVVAVPDYLLPTKQARAVLPEKASLADMVSNLQRACYLVASFFNQDLTHLDKAMDDIVYQPLRKHMIPGFDQVISAARKAGAKGVALSGAGPSILAFCLQDAEAVESAMQEGFAAAGIESRIYLLQPDILGAQVE